MFLIALPGFSRRKAERDSTNLRFLFGAGAATAIAARHAR